MRRVRTAAIAALLSMASLSVTASGAAAATLTATELLQQFNLITAGDANSNQHVHGRALIGGNLNGSVEVLQAGEASLPASVYDDAIVVGNQSGGKISAGGSGDISVGGTYQQVQNYGTFTNGAIDVPENFAQVLGTLSDDLWGLTANATAELTGNRIRFNQAPVGGLAVYDVALSDFMNRNIEGSLGGADLVVVNVHGSGRIPLGFATNAMAFGAKTIFNFGDAANLQLNGQFYGQILAPHAVVTVESSGPNGALFADTLNLYNSEIHANLFTGQLPQEAPQVPLPASLPLLLAGLGGIAMLRRRARG